MRLGIDLDGVLYDFYASWRAYMEHRKANYRGIPSWDLSKIQMVDGEPAHWAFYKDAGMTTEEFTRTFDLGVDARIIFCHGEPRPGSVEAMKRLKAAGHTLHIVTDRSRGTEGAARTNTIEWLAKHDIPYDDITFTADKAAVRVDAYVEDKTENFLDIVDSGMVCHLVNRPWNAGGMDAPAPNSVWRINSITDFADKYAPVVTELDRGLDSKAGTGLLAGTRMYRYTSDKPTTWHHDGDAEARTVDITANASWTAQPATGEVRVTSSTGGEKGQKLARFDLIPTDALTELAEHFGVGAKKYADRNWERGYEWGLSYAALSRHLTSFWGGEDIDPETGSKHMTAVVWHAMALVHFMNNNPEFDNRPGGAHV